MVRIVATSDLHGQLPDIPECDLFIIAGDVCPDGALEYQVKWLNTHFRNWLKNVPAKEIVGIAGNHDLVFETADFLVPKDLPWHYLYDSAIELFGFKIYGTPWQLPFWGAFNRVDAQLVDLYKRIPKDTNILISHGPAYGILDQVPDKRHTGSKALLKKVFEINPLLFICGHIHCAFGRSDIHKTIFANVSLLNNDMEKVNSPVLFIV